MGLSNAALLSLYHAINLQPLQALLGSLWAWLRTNAVVPLIRAAVMLCMVMSVMVLLEKLCMGAISLYVKLFRRRPEKVYKWQPLEEDPEVGNLTFPMVLVQIPMYNEKEVYKMSIGTACGLSWPSDRIVIQVLDDSTDPDTKNLVHEECIIWLEKGKNIKYETRDDRYGYKAGALKKGMEYDYVQKCEYVAIFDADFQPSSDFLLRTIPFLVYNPEIALVQARWKFVNANECLMTRIQEMSMDYHFKVEQESGSSASAFFGFNGTAGVWRIVAIKEAGGWKERTTVEDMDLAVRASLKGWKFVYVGNIKVKSELPSTFKAYRNQQHRWACGPANLFRKMSLDIFRSKKVSLLRKCYIIYNFFLARRIVSHFITFFFYCLVIPSSVFFPEVQIPKWASVYVPTVITLLNSFATPRSLHLVIFWVFFENVMSLHRCKAVFIGLLGVGRVNEWIVTEKLGDMLKKKPNINLTNRIRAKFQFQDRFHPWELVVGMYLCICASYDFAFGTNHYFIYLFPQSITFFIMGFGYVGTFVPDK